MSPPPPVSPAPPVSFRARVRASLGQSGRALALVWQSAPAGVVVLAVLTVVSAALPPFVAYVGKLIVDAVMAAQGAAAPLREAAIGRAVRLVVVELAAVVAIAGTERALGLVRQVVGLRLGIDINVRILEKALRLELSKFEDAGVLRQADAGAAGSFHAPALARAEQLSDRSQRADPGGLPARCWSAFSGWMAIALLAATVPAFLAEARFSGAAFRLRNWRSPDSRAAHLPRIRARERRAREGGQAVRPRALAPGPLSGAGRTIFRGRPGAGRPPRRVGLRVVAHQHAGLLWLLRAHRRGRRRAGAPSLGDMTLYLVAFRQGQQSFQAIFDRRRRHVRRHALHVEPLRVSRHPGHGPAALAARRS